MIYPLFDKKSDLVAWLKDDRHIFDTGMRWIAFIEKGNIWSAEEANWLGVIKDGCCTDTGGRVFAWNKRTAVRGITRPPTPTRPTRPTRPPMPTKPPTPTKPMAPVTPVFGWSALSLKEWLEQ